MCFRLSEDDLANSRVEDPPEQIKRLKSFGEVITNFVPKDTFEKFANKIGRTTDQDIDALRQQFTAHGQALTDRAAYLRQLQEKIPNTAGNMATARMETVQAAITLIGDWERQVRGSPHPDKARKIATLGRYRDTLLSRKSHLAGLRNSTAPVLATNRNEGSALTKAADAIAARNARPDAEGVSEQDLLTKVLERMCEEAELAPDHLEERFAQEIGVVINNRPWNEINNRIELQRPDRTIKLNSVIQPAGKFRGRVFGPYNGKGFNGHSTMEAQHAVNLARTELRNESGEVIFAGFRHGVNCAYGITPDKLTKLPEGEIRFLIVDLLENLEKDDRGKFKALTDGLSQYARETWSSILLIEIRKGGDTAEAICATLRWQANINRARECIQAAVLGDPAKLAEAEGAAKQGAGARLSLSINSISLLTPDFVRSSRGMSNDAERQMLEEQSAAWKALSGASMQITLPSGNTVTIEPQITTLDFGVNWGALVSSLPLDMTSGWDYLQGENGSALRDLVGDPQHVAVGRIGGRARVQLDLLESKIARYQTDLQDRGVNDETKARLSKELPALEKRMLAIQQLAQQIAVIWNDGSYRRDGDEPYKMVSRLAVLSHLLGDATFWNCKSGKDRTGQLDLEAKYLSELIDENGGNVPAPDRKRANRNEFYEFMLASGNIEMQQMSTLYGGFKLKGVDALYDQIGANQHPGRKNVYLGFSDYTLA